MSDKIATSVAYMALRHAGMPLPKRLVVHFSGGELATMTNLNGDGEGEIHELHEGDVRDLLTMHALRWFVEWIQTRRKFCKMDWLGFATLGDKGTSESNYWDVTIKSLGEYYQPCDEDIARGYDLLTAICKAVESLPWAKEG